MWLVAVAVVVVVVAVAVVFLSTRPSGPPVVYKTVEAGYIFLLPRGGSYELGYYDPRGSWRDLSTYNT
jgi:hypothetical protein